MTGLPYRALWRREVNAGLGGQDAARPGSWTLDHLWRAAVLQIRAEETERMLQESLDAHDHSDTIAHFLAQLKADREACHVEFLRGEEASRVA